MNTLPNLRSLVGARRRLRDLALAVLAGLMLAVAFPPLELEFLAWFWPAPLLLTPASRMKRWRAINGYALGCAAFLPMLWWLNTIGFAAGIILGLACAVFPLLWYLAIVAVLDRLIGKPEFRETPPRTDDMSLAPTWLSPTRFIAFMLFSAACWTTLEWTRSWILTGFPWNPLAASQWQNPLMLSLLPWTGVYGPGFVLVCVGFAVAWFVVGWQRRLMRGFARPSSWPGFVVVLLFLPVFVLELRGPQIPPPDRTLRLAAVQGNIPQIRIFTDREFWDALDVYDTLTRQAVRTHPELDLVVWPETAVPSPLFADPEYHDRVAALQESTGVPLLLGSLHIQRLHSRQSDATIHTNSALLVSAGAELVDFYSKTHLVPFGEYVPFGNALPALREAIGMGRDLTPGREFTIFNLPGDVRAGINICYEDAFPNISRRFALRGADLLFTLTNDAWYATSAGPRQHMIHAVLRAVENRRPLFRSGNNSDTCLILPDGTVVDALVDPKTGYPFVRGWRTYNVPVTLNAPLTFYTRHGDVFAWICTVLTAAALGWCLAIAMRRRLKLWQLISQE